jgi:hypothetical protein
MYSIIALQEQQKLKNTEGAYFPNPFKIFRHSCELQQKTSKIAPYKNCIVSLNFNDVL